MTWKSKFCEVTRTTFYQFLVKGHEEWWFELTPQKSTAWDSPAVTTWDLILVSDENRYSKHFGNYISREKAENATEDLVAMLLGTFFEGHKRHNLRQTA